MLLEVNTIHHYIIKSLLELVEFDGMSCSDLQYGDQHGN